MSTRRANLPPAGLDPRDELERMRAQCPHQTLAQLAADKLFADEVAHLKAQSGKNMVLVGGPKIAQALTRVNLIDAYHLYMHPTLIGEGTSVLGGLRSPRPMRVNAARLFKAGFVGLRFEPVR
jgi:dihydrofolate reductase